MVARRASGSLAEGYEALLVYYTSAGKELEKRSGIIFLIPAADFLEVQKSKICDQFVFSLAFRALNAQRAQYSLNSNMDFLFKGHVLSSKVL